MRQRRMQLAYSSVAGMLLVVILALAACSAGQASLRDGVLRQGIGQKAFRAQWGDPDQIVLILNGKMLVERWGQEVLLRAPAELWAYSRYGADVLFDDSGDLIAWKTELTREQLQAIPRRR